MPRKHPMQTVEWDGKRVIRFRKNEVVDWLWSQGKVDLNEIARQKFPAEDLMQFAQLLGYSVSGFADLQYASHREINTAYWRAARLPMTDDKAVRGKSDP